MPLPSRNNMSAWKYYRIAVRHETFVKLLSARLQELDSDDPDENDQYYEMVDELLDSRLTIVVFSAMALEAFIYDYALSNLGQAKADELTSNKKSFLQRWREIPIEVTGFEIPDDTKAMKLLAQLIDARNKLVHSRSLSGSYFDSNSVRKEREIQKIIHRASIAALETVHELAKELDNIDKKRPSRHLFTNTP